MTITGMMMMTKTIKMIDAVEERHHGQHDDEEKAPREATHSPFPPHIALRLSYQSARVDRGGEEAGPLETPGLYVDVCVWLPSSGGGEDSR